MLDLDSFEDCCSGIQNEDHLFIQRLVTGVSRESASLNDMKMVVHAAHGVSQADHHDDDQQVRASCSPPCQCHSGQDSRCSECATSSMKGEVRRYKQGINRIIISDDKKPSQMYPQIISSVLFCVLFAFLVVIVCSSFMSSNPSSSLSAVSSKRLSSQHTIAQQVVSCHSLACGHASLSSMGAPSASSIRAAPSGITCSFAGLTHATTFPS